MPGASGRDPVAASSFLVTIGTRPLACRRVSAPGLRRADLRPKRTDRRGPGTLARDVRDLLRQAVRPDPLVLTRAVDGDRTLWTWWRATVDGKDTRRTVAVDLLDGPRGALVARYVFHDAMPVRWTGPVLDAVGDTIAEEQLELVHERLDVE